MTAAPAEMISSEVRGNRVEPRCELLVRAKIVASAINANESFLRQIIRVVLVVDHSAEKMKQRRGVPLHQIVQRGIMACGQSFHVSPVTGITINARDDH